MLILRSASSHRFCVARLVVSLAMFFSVSSQQFVYTLCWFLSFFLFHLPSHVSCHWNGHCNPTLLFIPFRNCRCFLSFRCPCFSFLDLFYFVFLSFLARVQMFMCACKNREPIDNMLEREEGGHSKTAAEQSRLEQ